MSNLLDRFSLLPAEIRLEISKLLIEDTIPLIKHDTTSPTPTPTPTPHCAILSLAQTSQLLRTESLPLFKTRASIQIRLASVLDFLHTFSTPGPKVPRLIVDTRAHDARAEMDVLPLLAHLRGVLKREGRELRLEFWGEERELGTLLGRAVEAAKGEEWVGVVRMEGVRAVVVDYVGKRVEVRVDVEIMHVDAGGDDEGLLDVLGLSPGLDGDGVWVGEVV